MIRFLLILAAMFASPVAAQIATPGKNAIQTHIAAEAPRPKAGETVTLAFVMRPAPGWHGYWENPGDAGRGMQVRWTLPEGASAGRLRYPVPDRLTVAGLMNYVYKGPYAPLVDVSIPAGLAVGTKLPISAKLDYLACTDQVCVPESTTVATTLTVGDGMIAPGFGYYRTALPRPLGSVARFAVEGDRLRLGIPIPAGVAIEDPYFFPLIEGALAYSAVQSSSRSGDLLIVEVQAGSKAGSLKAVEGVLRIGKDNGLSLSAMPGAVPPLGEPLGGASSISILTALFGALLGGLLLNIMPCVFPILSLKALSLARAGGDEHSARREALAYAAGVILVCLALGGALLALRAGGAAAGWAFQLQDPRVILVLLLLVTAIALNLAGLFELPSVAAGDRLAQSGGTAGAFWTGALAAFVATPCTGPFMGAALGAALILPPFAALAVFAGLGLGLALPFLLLGFIPALRRRLPKPGPWMVRLRRILAVPMVLTAFGLLWILSRQTGNGGIALGLGAALLLALCLWWAGRKGRWWPIAPALLAGLGALLLIPQMSAPAEAQASAALSGETFSEARLAQLRASGRPVFVYFTADWCLTCKVNEAGALASDDVAAAFKARNVAVLVGDWTRGDPAIGRFLESHGRSGVPLYLYYAPGMDAEISPQILTAGRLTALGQ